VLFRSDPQGNSVYLQYNSNFRLTTITDAIGQVSTLTYVSNTLGNIGYYKISKITDPFGRFCTFAYDSSTTFLVSVTDVINLASQFIYDTSSSFITALTTPYGTTSFFRYPINYGQGIRFTFPDNTNSVIENWLGFDMQSYFWDRQTMATYPSDPPYYNHSHCVTTKFLLEGTAAPYDEAPVIEFVQPPLENRTIYTYAGETVHSPDYYIVGPSNKPITITRNISGGTNQVWSYQYNDLGYPTESIDPVGRKFTYTYDTNKIDLLEKRQTRASNNDLIGKWTYNSQHLPLTYIDGSGRQTTYTYNSFGELLTLTDPDNKVWTRTYDTDGYLTEIDGPLAGNNDKTTFTYDGFGRLYTVTNSTGYTITYNYDNANRITQVTYLDGTFEKTTYNKLDAIMQRDRLGRITQYTYDNMDQLAFEIDPLGRKTQYNWCDCGSLASLIDPAGHTTTWSHDLEGRLTTKTYDDSTTVGYTYDTVGRLQTRTDALNQIATYTYNLDNTLAQIAYTNSVNPTSNVNYTYDPNYTRLATVQNGWGTYTYTYNPYITNPANPPILGGGRLFSVGNNVITNSLVKYTYDTVGRTNNRTIHNAVSNSTTWTYDAMSRITNETNFLGSFGYNYVDDTPGSSKGCLRLSSMTYPNGQTTNFAWYNNLADERLQQISNLDPSSQTLSQFNYAYNPAGEITQWQQQQNGQNIYNNFGYDLAGQLTSAKGSSGIPNGPPYANQNYYSYDLASNRTACQRSSIQTFRIGGTITAGNQVRIAVKDKGLTGGTQTIAYSVTASDTHTSIAAKLAANITSATSMQSIGVTATSNNNILSVQSASLNFTTLTPSVSTGSTATITADTVNNGTTNAFISGSVTASDVLTITVFDNGLPGGQKAINYTVLAGDTLNSIASGLAANINADTDLQSINVFATSASFVVSIKSNSINPTTYTSSISAGSTESIALSINNNGIQTAYIGGTKTTGNILTITVYDTALSGGSKSINYTVVAGGNLSSVATGLAAAISADADLQSIGVSATASNQVVNIKSNSLNTTTYSSSLSGGATVTITLGPNTGIQQYSYNNVNALTSISAGGNCRFEGITNKAVKSVTLNGSVPATLNWSKSFTGNAVLNPGINATTVAAVDGANNTVTNTYQVIATSATSSSPTHDANGNMTSDGTNSYLWDAENRLIKITYPGTNNYSDFTYDGLGHWVKFVETINGSVNSTKQFIWAGDQLVEYRNGTSGMAARYYSQGQTVSGTKYFYNKDHLGSIRTVTNTSGSTVAQYAYDNYGQATRISGTFNSDLQYAGYYFHPASSLNLTVNRAYNPSLGRWINRDPIGESGGINLYGYVDNDPINFSDALGLFLICMPKPVWPPISKFRPKFPLTFDYNPIIISLTPMGVPLTPSYVSFTPATQPKGFLTPINGPLPTNAGPTTTPVDTSMPGTEIPPDADPSRVLFIPGKGNSVRPRTF